MDVPTELREVKYPRLFLICTSGPGSLKPGLSYAALCPGPLTSDPQGPGLDVSLASTSEQGCPQKGHWEAPKRGHFLGSVLGTHGGAVEAECPTRGLEQGCSAVSLSCLPPPNSIRE